MAGEKIAALLIAATIAVTLLSPINAAVVSNTGTQSVQNESVTASTDYQELEGYDIDNGETVYWLNESSGNYETLTEGDDYDINRSSGSIAINDSGQASEGDDLQTTYDYQASNAVTETVVTLAPLFVGLLILGIIASRVQRMM